MVEAKNNDSNYKVRFKCKQAYQVPDVSKLSIVELLLKSTLENNIGNDKIAIDNAWSDLGFKAREMHLRDKNYLSLMEHNQNECEGKGNYIFSPSAKNKLIIQAPHSYYDKYTGKIVEQLFFNADFFAAFWNSAHRYSKKIIGFDSADLSKARQSYFMSFSKAVAKNFPSSFLIQIHGFTRKKRNSLQGKGADMILSQGGRIAADYMFSLKSCLQNNFNDKNIYLYPHDINELGATKNSIALHLNQLRFFQFIHIEINRPLRKVLLEDKTQLNKLSECLMELPNAVH